MAEASFDDNAMENILCKGCNQSYPATVILKHINHQKRSDCRLKYTPNEILELETQSKNRRLELKKKKYYSPQKRSEAHQKHYSPEENAEHYSTEKRADLHKKHYSPEKRADLHKKHYSPEKMANLHNK